MNPLNRPQQHIIKQISAELFLPASLQKEDSTLLLKKAVEVAVDRLESKLDQTFGESLYRLESLLVELSLNEDDLPRLSERLEEALIENIMKAAQAVQTESDEPDENKRLEKIEPEQHRRDLLTCFLQTGQWPWWAEGASFAELEEELREMSSRDWLEFIIPLAQDHSNVLTRLATQFPVSLVQDLLKKSAYEAKSKADEVLQLLDEIARFLKAQDLAYGKQQKIITQLYGDALSGMLFEEPRDLLLRNLITAMLKSIGDTAIDKAVEMSDSEAAKVWKRWLRQSDYAEEKGWLKEDEEVPSELSKEDVDDSEEVEETDDFETFKEHDFAVHNAGLVLLHPFVKLLFDNLALLDDGIFLTEEARERGVCLLHYLATGSEEFPEHKLVLPKFLCGWPIEQPVNRFLPVSDYEKEECIALIASAVNHWEALKNTSPEEFQHGFLQRSGSLKREVFGWSLYIERKPQDILLEKLPWELSVVKHDWMDEMLTIQW